MSETREIVVRLQLEYPAAQPQTAITVTADQPLLFTTRQAARLLAIGESVVRELIARGEIESVKIGNARRITRAGIERYVRQLQEGAAP
jgi:excisionase family DNA binding protein